MIPVTKPYLPSRAKLDSYIDGIYERNWITNNGPLVQELTKRLEEYLKVENLLLVANGTLALQIAYRALGINDAVNGKPAEAITTPFTFVATSSSLKWEGVEPVFVDIDPDTWCMAPQNIQSAITYQTRSIVPVHVFGNACEVEEIQKIADKHDLKVIYDAAHAFGVKYKGESLLKWGDAATLSFHATKVFHTIEGGAIVFKRKKDLAKAQALINFGLTGPEAIEEMGINAKMNEFNAAMGLCVLDEISIINTNRGRVWSAYHEALDGHVVLQKWHKQTTNNHAYFPVVLDSAAAVKAFLESLKAQEIHARRYFYPSLNETNLYGEKRSLPVAKALADRVLCLPIYPSVDELSVMLHLTQLAASERVINLENFSDDEIIHFVEKMDSHFVPPMTTRVNLKDYIQKLKKYGKNFGVVSEEGGLVGLLSIYVNDQKDGVSYISYLSVHPCLQGRGISRLLINRALLVARLNGMSSIQVSTWEENVSAINIYERAGFTVTNRALEAGRTTVFLKLAL
jgi:dTDP-4-amino-4,6-dideoxygalactose transaminase/GNAT superfamily N-acetyltransferase